MGRAQHKENKQVFPQSEQAALTESFFYLVRMTSLTQSYLELKESVRVFWDKQFELLLKVH
jgi:hypothetical protein